MEAARKVLAALEDDTRSRVVLKEARPYVGLDDSGRWAVDRWHVELTGSSERLAEPTREDVENDPETAAILDWLALLIEDALHTKWRGEGR